LAAAADESEQSCEAATAFPLGHESSHRRTDQLTAAPGVMQALGNAAADNCFPRRMVARPTSAMATERNFEIGEG
jgi:hypothetical protein